MFETVVVVPNWNGKKSLSACLESLQQQSLVARIVVVENGSTDGSLEFVEQNFPDVKLVINKKNLGFAAGVNVGIRWAMENGAKYVGLFNNDAVAEKDWLKNLVGTLQKNSKAAVATCKFMSIDKKKLDSTGDLYSVWGLPFPRGRDEPVSSKYDSNVEVFAASGGASLYRIKALEEIGLFDEDFFAYYEDVDLSFRAQLSGWVVRYEPMAVAYHQIGATSSKIKGFTTYQTMKNLPWLFWKNVPTKYLLRVGWRFNLAYFSFLVSAIARGQGLYAFRGLFISLLFAPKKLLQRWRIQFRRKVSPEYIWGIVTHDLPPNANKLHFLRSKWWEFIRKS